MRKTQIASRARVQRRVKRHHTFSLAPDVVQFIEAFRDQVKAPSMTAALEALVRQQMRLRKEQELAAQMTAFYDSLPPGERQEELEWAAFAEWEVSRTEG